jgi:hypothetical protein
MTTTELATQAGFHSVLAAPGRSPEIPADLDVYGWLVGSWSLEVLHYRAIDVSGQRLKGEAHFGWVLEGRAIQDVWIMPNHMYGTTLRVWDASIHAWRITWINPATGHREEQIGRWSGRDIVQVGTRSDGTPTRWMYTEITPESFRWTGEALQADGKSWKLEGEFRATKEGSR